MYGMNFKGMPEYDWAWGYPYALGMIALSAVLPLAWFKWRDWPGSSHQAQKPWAFSLSLE